jgi:hypothetical protein
MKLFLENHALTFIIFGLFYGITSNFLVLFILIYYQTFKKEYIMSSISSSSALIPQNNSIAFVKWNDAYVAYDLDYCDSLDSVEGANSLNSTPSIHSTSLTEKKSVLWIDSSKKINKIKADKLSFAMRRKFPTSIGKLKNPAPMFFQQFTASVLKGRKITDAGDVLDLQNKVILNIWDIVGVVDTSKQNGNNRTNGLNCFEKSLIDLNASPTFQIPLDR